MTRCCCKSRSSMSPTLLTAVMVGALVPIFSTINARPEDPKPATPAAADAAQKDIYSFTPNLITGAPHRLENYRGEVILVVNVASKCGLTPQYEALQALYESRADKGFVILAFPANNFMNQEPGSNAEIAAFCTAEYGVTFPVFEKISVKGDDIDPLYAMLTSQPEPIGGEIRWNFDKFLINREGKIVARFGPRTSPNDPEFTKTIDALIAEPQS